MADYSFHWPMASLDFISKATDVKGFMGSFEQRALMYHMGLTSVCAAEIGAYYGLSSVLVGTGMKGHGTYYCIDNFQSSNTELERGVNTLEGWHDSMRRYGLQDTCVPVVGWSFEAKVLDQIPDGLDFVYVDGDHEFHSVVLDALLYRRKLRRNGLLLFHDAPWANVKAAMARVVELGCMTHICTVDDFALYRTTETPSPEKLVAEMLAMAQPGAPGKTS